MLTLDDYNAKVDWLVEQAKQYYVLDNPLVSDYEYDVTFAEVLDYEQSLTSIHQLRLDSPTRRVGGSPIKSFTQVTHQHPMLSLDNAFSEEDVTKWTISKSIDPEELVSVEYKMDGLAISIRYVNRKLHCAATRGDGVVGEDVTHNVVTIRNLPLEVDYDYPDFEIRGEVVITTKDFEAINAQRLAEGKAVFANPRNAAAGAMRQLDPKLCAERRLMFYAYERVMTAAVDAVPQNQRLERLQSLGFSTTAFKVCKAKDAFNAIPTAEERKSLPFEIDGMVIKVNDPIKRQQLGTLSRVPNWAIAYKFPAELVTTTLENIITQVGPSGVVTPMAVVTPVRVSGVTVSSVTLHNFDEVRRLRLVVGGRVWLKRAGEVIPKIVGMVEDAGGEYSYPDPTQCPCCGQPLQREPGGVFLYCTDTEMRCTAQQARRLIHFASKGAMDIDGLADRTVEALFDLKLVGYPADLYRLTKEQLLQVPKMGELKVTKLLKAIEQSKQPKLAKFLYALCIPGIGESTARDLVKTFGTLERIQSATLNELIAVPDVGVITATNLIQYFVKNQTTIIDPLLAVGVVPQSVVVITTDLPLTGKTIVLTGSTVVPRPVIKEALEALGAKVSSSVSAKTDLVLYGPGAGDKLTQATKLGVRLLPAGDISLTALHTLFD